MNTDYKAQRGHFFTGFANGFGKKNIILLLFNCRC